MTLEGIEKNSKAIISELLPKVCNLLLRLPSLEEMTVNMKLVLFYFLKGYSNLKPILLNISAEHQVN